MGGKRYQNQVGHYKRRKVYSDEWERKKRLKSETLSAGQIIQLTDYNVVASSLQLLRQHGHTIKCYQKSFTRPWEFFLLIKLYTSVNERIKNFQPRFLVSAACGISSSNTRVPRVAAAALYRTQSKTFPGSLRQLCDTVKSACDRKFSARVALLCTLWENVWAVCTSGVLPSFSAPIDPAS